MQLQHVVADVSFTFGALRDVHVCASEFFRKSLIAFVRIRLDQFVVAVVSEECNVITFGDNIQRGYGLVLRDTA